MRVINRTAIIVIISRAKNDILLNELAKRKQPTQTLAIASQASVKSHRFTADIKILSNQSN